MSDISKFSKRAFSQPYGPAQLYGPPPYAYRDARSITAVFTAADRAGIQEFLPPGVELADAEPLLLTTVSHYPQSGFGSYNEFWVYVRVVFGGERYMYAALMYADSESAAASGRELWGFPKKWAKMSLSQEADQWFFTADRPVSHRLLELSLVVEDSREPAMLKEISLPAAQPSVHPQLPGQGRSGYRPVAGDQQREASSAQRVRWRGAQAGSYSPRDQSVRRRPHWRLRTEENARWLVFQLRLRGTGCLQARTRLQEGRRV
ncbi:MAG: acetoacetate decarboxylase protein [Gammaproteobacteria bacterium]|nr:acetoacetate decarboxylase protein [Gammaproteobacteria bacterium]